MEQIARSITLNELKSILIGRGVPADTWKKTGPKTLKRLHSDVRSGAVEIETFETGEGPVPIERHVTSVVVDVVNDFDGDVCKLQERRHRLGKSERKLRTDHSVSGRIRPNESPLHAAIRCLREKFRITVPIHFVESRRGESPQDSIRRFRRKSPSKAVDSCIITAVYSYQNVEDDTESYPGLTTVRTLHLFVCEVPGILADPNKFTRKFGSKVIIHAWVNYDKESAHYYFDARKY